MKHLSGLDALFLHLESPEMPMHVGSLNVLDLPPGYSGDFYEDAKARVAERMHLAELFTRKLALMPFDLANPVWVPDDDIDLDYHVRHVSLPKPGSNRQLQQYVARLHSSLLDRSRPLWEFFVIDGLRSGQVALYAKVHHAGMDGQAGVAVAQAIFDLAATGREVPPPPAHARSHTYQPSVGELGRAALKHSVRKTSALLKGVPALAKVAGAALAQRVKSGERKTGAIKLFGPRTRLNVNITNQRSFAGRTIALDETKLIGKTLGGSLNDVVMCTVAGALRRYLLQHQDLPHKTLLAAVPVSLREKGDASANNQVSMIAQSLHTHLASPLERLAAIHKDSNANKAMLGQVKASLPTDFPLPGAPWLLSGLAALVGRSGVLGLAPPIANVVVSNVPGSPLPVYFAGARLACYYPVSIVTHSIALNITVQSYAGRLDYGLIACRRAVPDINDLGDHLLAEHQALLACANAAALAERSVGAPATPAPKRTARKAVRTRAPRKTAEVAALAAKPVAKKTVKKAATKTTLRATKKR
jgi:diacylglycerol O-acyltransferase / wax synthase